MTWRHGVLSLGVCAVAATGCASVDDGYGVARSHIRSGGPVAAPAPPPPSGLAGMTAPAGTGLIVWTDAGWRDAAVSARLPKCARINNYWCVKTPGADTWNGQIGEDDRGHAQFDHPTYSARAFVRLMHTYRFKHGVTSLRGIVYRYAPPGDCIGSNRDPRTGLCPDGANSPSAYAWWVAEALGVGLDEPLPLFVDERTVNADWMAALAVNMAAFEMGRAFRPHPALVEDGIRMAGLGIVGGEWLCAEAESVPGAGSCGQG